MAGRLSMGTSGIVVPGTKKTFPEQFRSRSRLHYYSTLFNSLEVNSSFYKIPLPATFEKWTLDVTEEFTFTVKLWRGITHAKKLDFTFDDIERFMSAINRLGSKKGCLLIQFPASITINYFEQVSGLLRYVSTLNANAAWKVCVEFRHSGWYTETAYTMLENFNASLVLHDMPASRTPVIQNPGEIIYVRFHGPEGDYRGGYSEDVLMDYAKRIRHWLISKDVFVYFNNTIGSAFDNCLLLREVIIK